MARETSSGYRKAASNELDEEEGEDSEDSPKSRGPAPRRGGSGRRLLRQAWTSEQQVAIDACLSSVERQKGRFHERGLSNKTWFFGVANTIFVAWSFGAIPQHFWLVYMIETAILFPVKFGYQMSARPLSQILHWLDFCWIANFTGNAVLLYLLMSEYDTEDVRLADEQRKFAFCLTWGIATGPLIWAVGVMGNSLVFHDLDGTTNTFIHVFPNFVMYTLRWHRAEVLKTWPGLFRLDYFDEINVVQDIYVSAFGFYFLWMILYVIWLFSCGLRLPESGYDTVFHVNMRGGIGALISRLKGVSKEEHARRVQENDFDGSYVPPYLLLHAVAVSAGILASALAWDSRALHGALSCAMVLSMCLNGAKRYNYFLTESYAAAIRDDLGIP